MAQVTIRDLRKSYGAMDVLHGVNVDIENGQFVVLVGPSGCGKSTLMHLLGGLDKPTEGRVLIENINIAEMNARAFKAKLFS